MKKVTRYFQTDEHITIAADELGDADAPTVIFLHGFGQTRHSWGAAVEKLAAHGFHVINADHRGHGASTWAREGEYELEHWANDLRHIIQEVGGKPALVGASLGGLASLLAAGENKDLPCSALVLVDMVPKVEMEGANEIMGFMAETSDGFSSIEEAAERVAAYLPNRKRPPTAEGLKKNLRLHEDGKYRWHWDPKMMIGKNTFDPQTVTNRMERAARNIKLPVLLVRGALSRVVSDEGVAQFRELIPHAEYVNISKADHMVAGDRNDAFFEPVFEFIKRTLS